jgi:two-component system sensor histidine kinase PilS (NtrC family)
MTGTSRPALLRPAAADAPVPGTGAPGSESADSIWRSLALFNVYRLVVAVFFIVITALFGGSMVFGSHDLTLFRYASVAYLVFGVAGFLFVRARIPAFELQLGIQTVGDIAFLVVLTHASGGIASGTGLLLLASLAAAGLISRGRLTLFYAALACMAILLEQTYSMLAGLAPVSQYLQAAMLSIGYFATASLAHGLARYARASERLAKERGVDLANLSQVNQLVIQDMHDGVLVVDGEGRLRQRNTQAERLLGIGAGAELRLGALSPALAERFEAWRTHAASEFDLLRFPAANRLVRTRFVAIGSSRSRGAVIFLEDMSRVQAQAQQLKLASLGRLTANIAHEIRNPLSAISHAAELLQEEPGAGPVPRRLADIVRDNALRLNRLVEEIMQLSRRDRVQQECLPAADFLRAFIDGFVRNEQLPRNAIALDAQPDAVVCFDRAHLNQVLWNLCRNAWRHCSKREASVRLRAAAGATSNSSIIEVMDDGPGIPDPLRNQVFEPFFTTVASGTGLGLYIAREMCEANGATLDCLGGGGGAHFRITCRRDHVKAQRASDAIRH